MAILTMTGESTSRSINLRGAPLDRTPVPAAFPPYQLFEPDDMLVSWILREGSLARSAGTFNAYLWPKEREDNRFARWQTTVSGGHLDSTPDWLCTVADELRTAFNEGTPLPEGEIRTGVGLERKFLVEGAGHTVFRGAAFDPAELSVSWIAGDDEPHQRYRMTVRPDRKKRNFDSRDWVGTHSGGYKPDTPVWAIAAAEQCRLDMLALRSA